MNILIGNKYIWEIPPEQDHLISITRDNKDVYFYNGDIIEILNIFSTNGFTWVDISLHRKDSEIYKRTVDIVNDDEQHFAVHTTYFYTTVLISFLRDDYQGIAGLAPYTNISAPKKCAKCGDNVDHTGWEFNPYSGKCFLC
jgi:hypothetical protein